MITVGLVEPNPMVRSGMLHLLEAAGLRVVAGGDIEAIAPVDGVTMLVLSVAGDDALAATAAAVEQTGAPVLALADHLTDVALAGLLEAGARGVLLEVSVPHLLVHAVDSVIAGGVFIDPQLVSRLVALLGRGQPASGRHGLTTQERRVLALLPVERTNRNIAHQLGISTETVKTHMRNATRKLGAYDRIDATRIVLEHGIDNL